MLSLSPIPDHAPIALVNEGTVYDYGNKVGTLVCGTDPPQGVIARWAESPQKITGVRYV